MSSIMNDLEKIQVALSGILADFLRQSFTALALLAVVLKNDWVLALWSLTVLRWCSCPPCVSAAEFAKLRAAPG